MTLGMIWIGFKAKSAQVSIVPRGVEFIVEYTVGMFGIWVFGRFKEESGVDSDVGAYVEVDVVASVG